MANLKDVARCAGVNPSLVSRLLNEDSSLTVRPETRARVLKCVQELKYRPNHAARSLKVKHTSTIAVVIPSFVFPIHNEIVRGIEQAAHEQGYRVVVGSTEHELGSSDSYLDTLESSQVDGVIIADSFIEDEKIDRFSQKGIPYVLVSKRKSRDNYIALDSFNASRTAVEHLISRGHRRIGTLTGLLHIDEALERMKGYRTALSNHGLEFDHSLMAEGDFTRESGYAGMGRILQAEQPPTAVFVGNLNMTLGACMKLKEIGKTLPHPVAVVGFHDYPLVTEPLELTMIRFPVYDMGGRSFTILHAMMNAERQAQAHPVEQLELSNFELVVRASSFPLATN